MARLVVLVGLQASGKSTFYARHLAATHVHVSKDHWPNSRRRDSRQQRVVAAALGHGHSVAVDNTNASIGERAALIALARAAGVPVVGYWFPPDLSESLQRNSTRAGRARVPDVGLFATAKRLTPPTRQEGFDEVCEVRFDGVGGFTVTPLP
ncbi:AAA family ATPase [Saccharothrix deserti]|uniref:AAA family ATPase n=1 Tax=Saccharothrix deserti TaxID=2593674 RepID=UPI00131C118C|nr:AAA family ATPase [Saccharothrix deserti]